MPTCRLSETVGEAKKRTKSAGVDICVVVDETGIVFGVLRSEELGREDNACAEEVMRSGPSTFRPHVPIAEMADYMRDHDVDAAPITTSAGKLVGVLFRDDAVTAAEGQR